MTDQERPRNAGHDAPSSPWQSSTDIRPDLAADGDHPPTTEEQAAGDAKARNREPGSDVAVKGSGTGAGTDQGQEADSVSEPG